MRNQSLPKTIERRILKEFTKEERQELYNSAYGNKEVDKELFKRLLDSYEDEKSFHEDTFRAIAKEMIVDWVPWEFEEGGKSQNNWGVPGLGGFLHKDEDGRYNLWVHSQKKQGMGTNVPLIYGLRSLRLSAISTLVFCELEEMRNKNES